MASLLKQLESGLLEAESMQMNPEANWFISQLLVRVCPGGKVTDLYLLRTYKLNSFCQVYF